MSQLTTLQRRARRIHKVLGELYPDAQCALDFVSPFQLLIATILSAQCTDVRVNLVTPQLFARFPTAADFAQADLPEIEQLIRSVNFWRNKAKNILDCCRILVAKHNGEVPNTMEQLVVLPGVGRKTANVVLSEAFNIPGITVDTHLGRVSRRLGLTTHEDPVKVEADIARLLPAKSWTSFNHRMITHGRQVCHARKPDCPNCVLRRSCPKVDVTPAPVPPPVEETTDVRR